MKKELQERNSAVFGKIVPGMGNAGTIEGEMLRAINKIVYRHWNDGDYFFQGYGCETAGPAHAFLISNEIPSTIAPALKLVLDKATFKFQGEYVEAIESALEIILDYIDSKQDNFTESSVDMYSYQPIYQDDEEEEDDACWDCGRSCYDCYCSDDDEE